MGGHVTRMNGMKNPYKILIKNYEGKKTHIKPRRIGEMYIEKDLKEMA
jgi:hypothetical protein